MDCYWGGGTQPLTSVVMALGLLSATQISCIYTCLYIYIYIAAKGGNGKEHGSYYGILGLYGNTGKENGNYRDYKDISLYVYVYTHPSMSSNPTLGPRPKP